MSVSSRVKEMLPRLASALRSLETNFVKGLLAVLVIEFFFLPSLLHNQLLLVVNGPAFMQPAATEVPPRPIEPDQWALHIEQMVKEGFYTWKGLGFTEDDLQKMVRNWQLPGDLQTWHMLKNPPQISNWITVPQGKNFTPPPNTPDYFQNAH